ncbi:G-type lectin S-receptor-like serine/threonine-protein kinase RKS1 isoform X3 [Arachis ipaensis]|uniref:G-type lectin S-receptor-like serine/threonine-protein kinase RKS1 isoform X3 n=1 Tax=Arachis ipaensis TaxID=130454 RepID=UPI000A2B2222|nr:G-type lectin S-receptor-like serine/threonine-protein kinase RKS1 isoform X3 [Arachis ipaensis]
MKQKLHVLCLIMGQNQKPNLHCHYWLLSSLTLVLLNISFGSCFDTISTDKALRDGEILVSRDKTFAMGFFSPGRSTSRYIGIWYNNLPQQTVIWVANRNTPINDTSGVLSINQHGNLALHHNHSILPIWSTNVSVTPSDTNKVIAQLTDIANLVLILNDTKTVIWQSFDQPTDTLIPHLRLGFDRGKDQSWVIQSWKTDDDPSPGDFTLKFSTNGMPQLFLYHKNLPWWRGGPWNGEFFMGIPNMKRDNNIFNVSCEEDENHAALSYNTYDKSVPSWVVVQQSGFFQVFTWDNQKNQWNRYWSEPTGQCDNYGTCGPNSNCDPLNYEDFQCTCLPGFEPKFPRNWYENRDGSGGCARKKGASVCGSGEGFVNIEGLKVPDTSVAIVKEGLSLEECEKECLRNCTCNAYSVADIRNGGSGCMTWHGDLMDIQKLSDQGQDLFIRVDSFELAKYYKRPRLFGKNKLVTALVAFMLLVLLLVSSVYYLWKKSKNKATEKFSPDNKLGQGGFGSVYKGHLFDGQEIAVKRLSKDSGQGIEEFINEVRLLVKLQHRNLVRLLGCCLEKEERMLVYEYLPNKSLDFLIFDEVRRSSLDWGQRFKIISGIARGVLYLHQDSRLKIIHRDLKASNVLLDAVMNPKISDFGMARIFGEEQIHASTKKVVGTYGYMSPEYAMEGRYSTKSDVFSFGVLLLEIIAGKRNTNCEKGRAASLIGYVWKLWTEGRALDVVDSTLGQSYPPEIALRCIQIGLLCVQESINNRPSMLEVVFMLCNEAPICSPQKPAFLFNGNLDMKDSSTSGGGSSVNEVTVTTISAR